MATNALHHGGGGAHEFEPDATNDPLLGTQEHPDQIQEVVAEPETESAAWPTHGRAEKSRTVAGVLGIFLGWLGLHRFYLGYTRIGQVELGLSIFCFGVVFVTALFLGYSLVVSILNGLSAITLIGLWGVIEGLMILGGQMEHDGHARPLR